MGTRHTAMSARLCHVLSFVSYVLSRVCHRLDKQAWRGEVLRVRTRSECWVKLGPTHPCVTISRAGGPTYPTRQPLWWGSHTRCSREMVINACCEPDTMIRAGNVELAI